MTSKMRICKEKPYPLGCYIDYDNSLVVRAVFDGTGSCGVTLYPAAQSKVRKPLKIELSDSFRNGRVYSARVQGIDDIQEYASYNYFCGEECFCDPYAKHVLGLEAFGKDAPDSEIRAGLFNKSQNRAEGSFDWGKEKNIYVPYEDSLIYLLHVRGFTKSASSGVSAASRGTVEGIIEKLPYLKELGVTTLELMPVYEMNEVDNPYRNIRSVQMLADKTANKAVYSNNGDISDKSKVPSKVNFWGYKRGFYFAPRASYCRDSSDPENEFKRFIKTMHENGIEVVLQFYFDEDESETLIMDALRFWRCNYHVDGFHLKGMRTPVRAIVNEPLFTDMKIWNEWFDYNDVMKGRSGDLRYLADYNNGFLYSSRRFLKSDDNTVQDFVKAMLGNSTDHAVVNYICNYEGFRLFDLVSYEHKHNEENGENNKDGNDNNLSWNCGIEGRTRKQNILSLRRKQIKNILTMLFMAQGTPMIFSGDEFGNSQGGNNNPYCQDNETGWVDWKAMDRNKDLLDYVKMLIKLKKDHSILHEKLPYKLMDHASCGYPDLSCHGREAWRPDMSGHSHLLGMMYSGAYEKQAPEKNYIYVAYNMNWTDQELALPGLPEGLKWVLYSDTDPRPYARNEKKVKENVRDKVSAKKETENTQEKEVFSEHLYERSVRIYISARDENYKAKKKEKGRNNKNEKG